jgi:hypothetical protein
VEQRYMGESDAAGWQRMTCSHSSTFFPFTRTNGAEN